MLRKLQNKFSYEMNVNPIQVTSKRIFNLKRFMRNVNNREMIHTENKYYFAYVDSKQCLNITSLDKNPLKLEEKNFTIPQTISQNKYLSISFDPYYSNVIACLDIEHILSIYLIKSEFLFEKICQCPIQEVNFFQHNLINHGEILISSGVKNDSISIWDYLDAKECTKKMSSSIITAEWCYKGLYCLITLDSHRIVILFNERLDERINFSEKRTDKCVLLDEFHLFVCGKKDAMFDYALYELNYEVCISKYKELFN